MKKKSTYIGVFPAPKFKKIISFIFPQKNGAEKTKKKVKMEFFLKKETYAQLNHSFKNQTKLVGSTGSTRNRPLI